MFQSIDNVALLKASLVGSVKTWLCFLVVFPNFVANSFSVIFAVPAENSVVKGLGIVAQQVLLTGRSALLRAPQTGVNDSFQHIICGAQVKTPYVRLVEITVIQKCLHAPLLFSAKGTFETYKPIS